MKKQMIWSNTDLDSEDWRESYAEYLEANELDLDPNDESALCEYMYETNDYYLLDVRNELNINLNQQIIVIGDIGRWNGRVPGYKMIKSGNIKDCFYSDTDYIEWYVDERGDFRATASHHDGTNYYLYRVFKDGVTNRQIENLQDKICSGKAKRSDITRLTKRLGDDIAEIYGFSIPKQRVAKDG